MSTWEWKLRNTFWFLDCDPHANMSPNKNPSFKTFQRESNSKDPSFRKQIEDDRGVGNNRAWWPRLILKNWKSWSQITWTINIFISRSLHNGIPCLKEVFPPQILLRGHGPTCSVHPRPPRPPGAARPRRRGLRGLPSAAVFGLGSREPEAEAAGQNPNGTKGRKNSEKNLGTSKVESFGNCCHSKSSLDLS